MKRFKGLIFIPLAALLVTACDNNDVSSSTSATEDPSVTTTSDDPTSTTSSPTVTVDSVLNALQDDVAFEGTLSIKASDSTGEVVYDSVYSFIEGYIGSDRFFNIETEEDGTESYRVEYYANEDTGYVEARYLDPTTNETAITSLVSSSTGNPTYFVANFFNPWLYVDSSMGTLVDDTVTFELDSTTGNYLFYLFTFYSSFVATTATVEVDTSTGAIETVTFATATTESTLNGEPVDAWYEFSYEIVTLDDIDYYNVDPRTGDENTASLQSVFNSLQDGNYTADVTVSGGRSTITSTIYSTPSLIIEDYNGEIYGVVDYDEGYKIVSGISGETTLTASNNTYSGSASNFLRPFTILAEMFDYVGDNTYVYANRGTEDYLYLTMPESMFYDYEPSVGTYTWVLNSDGTVSISYSTDSGYSVSVEVSAIGTTDLSRFSIEVDDPADSWDDVDGAAELLAKFNIPTDAIPWFDDLTGWAVYDYYSYGYGVLVHENTIDADANTIHSALLAAGWSYTGINSYSEYAYTLDLEDGSGLTLNISFVISYGYIYIYLYPADNVLTEFIADNFSDYTSLNYTLNTVYYETVIPANSTTWELDYDSATTYEYTYSVQYDNDKALIGNYLYVEVDTGINVYYGASGTYSYYTSYQNSADGTYTVGGSLYSLYHLSLASSRHFYQTSYDGDMYYFTLGTNALYYLGAASQTLTSSELQGYTSWTGEASFDASTGTIHAYIYGITNSYYWLDSSYSTLGYIYSYLDITISNVGTTSISVTYN